MVASCHTQEVGPAPVVVVKETEPYPSTEGTHGPVVYSKTTICVLETTHVHPTTEACKVSLAYVICSLLFGTGLPCKPLSPIKKNRRLSTMPSVCDP